MGDQGLAWLVFNVVLVGVFFLPTLITLLFRRDRVVFLVLALNTAVFWALSLYPALYAITFVAVFWRACIGEPGFGPALLRPDKRRWTERQCPACARWNDRTAESCGKCGQAVVPLDQSCPRCNEAMPPAATYCLSCGFDQANAVSEPLR